eukprot:103916-Pleurochrysis_carterae.AAC.1
MRQGARRKEKKAGNVGRRAKEAAGSERHLSAQLDVQALAVFASRERHIRRRPYGVGVSVDETGRAAHGTGCGIDGTGSGIDGTGSGIDGTGSGIDGSCGALVQIRIAEAVGGLAARFLASRARPMPVARLSLGACNH